MAVFVTKQINDPMVHVAFGTVLNSNLFRSIINLSFIFIHLNWTICVLFNPLTLVCTASYMLHYSHWLVWLIEWHKPTDLPQLQSVKLGAFAFRNCHSVVFESKSIFRLMIQICHNSRPFYLVQKLLLAMVAVIEKRLAKYPTTSKIHWQCEVVLKWRMNG